MEYKEAEWHTEMSEANWGFVCQTSLGVKIGRTVGFQSGDRHGLHIPSTGPRCAMVIMYTTYRSDDEMDYISTIQMLQRVEEIRMEKNVMDHAEVMNNFKNMGELGLDCLKAWMSWEEIVLECWWVETGLS